MTICELQKRLANRFKKHSIIQTLIYVEKKEYGTIQKDARAQHSYIVIEAIGYW